MMQPKWSIDDFRDRTTEVIIEFQNQYTDWKNDELFQTTAEKLIDLYDQLDGVDSTSKHSELSKKGGLQHLWSISRIKHHYQNGELDKLKRKLKPFARIFINDEPARASNGADH